MLSELQKKKVGKFFDMYDLDNDGIINSKDPEIVIGNLAKIRNLQKGTPGFTSFRDGFLIYWNEMIKDADKDHDGIVSRKEWLDFHEILLADQSRFQETIMASAGYMFTLMDLDNNGIISLEEYGNWMRAYRLGDDAVSKETFSHLDINKDGKLSMKEMSKLIYEFYYSNDPNAPGNWCLGPL